MRQSMTGYATRQGETETLRWSWELRGVNAKGLDLRLRVPDWIDGLESALRAVLSKAVTRGSLQLSLRVQGNGAEEPLLLDDEQLTNVLAAMARIETRAMDAGLSLAPSTAADIVGLRGVMTAAAASSDPVEIRTRLMQEFDAVLADFKAMRASEGAALEAILAEQLSQVESLVATAAEIAEMRKPEMARRTRAALGRVLDSADGLDENRVLQELALIAVKADVTEELDRLRAHVAATRDLLDIQGPVGRKLDFLMQEFNREANTLCSKAQFTDLTRVGLDLKAVIDQMREQVQNLE
ncbi:MAG: YicC family protein [Rhodobacteraceae bacterium]|nr:YicC family protein [Paracoccaceae bacterium]